MKKIIVIFLFSLLTIATYSQGVRMGLAASPQLSWMKSDASSVESNGPQMGFSFGMITDFFFSERYSFSTGILINNTGGQLNYNDSILFKSNDKPYNLAPGAAIKYKIQYIEIPLSFRMESNQIGYFVYHAQFGVTTQMRVGASANIEGMVMSADGTEEIPTSVSGVGCKDEVAFFNMGYNIGVGVNYYFAKNTALTLGLLYTNGFIDATSNTDSRFNDNVSLRSMTLKVGILF